MMSVKANIQQLSRWKPLLCVTILYVNAARGYALIMFAGRFGCILKIAWWKIAITKRKLW